MSHRIGIDARKIRDFGIGTYIRHLIGNLAEIDRERQYVLFVRPEDAASLRSLPDNFEQVIDRSPVYSLREQLTLPWHIWRSKLDLFHATHYVLPLLLPCPAVVTIHDIIHLLYPDFLPSRAALIYAQGMFRRSLAQSQRVISVSHNTKADLLDHFDVSERKIKVIHNGVAEVYREHLVEAEIDRWMKTLQLQRPYLLFVGNPKPHKNLDNVVKAYARARQLADFDAPLVCVGAREGSDFKLKQRASLLGVGDDLRLLGHVASEALPAIYQGASVFLYPTLYEGFGLPVVEAMASGVPVMTSNTSAPLEIADGCAELVDPLDIEAMARAIVRLITDRERAAELARRGLERSAQFDWRRTAEQTLKVYLSVLRARSSTPTRTS